MPKTQKVKKSMDEETAAKVRADNELVREKREAVASEIATRISKFKNDFMSAPIRRAMEASATDKVLDPESLSSSMLQPGGQKSEIPD